MKKQKQPDTGGNDDETESFQIIVKPQKNNNSLKSIDQYETNENNYSIQNRKQTINPNETDLFSD